MATYYSTHMAPTQNTSNDKDTGNGLSMVKANFTVGTALADADIVQMLKLPPNSVVFANLSGCYLDTLAGGTSPTYAIGNNAYTDNADATVALDLDSFVITEAAVVGAQLMSADPGAGWATGGIYWDLNNKDEVTVTWELDGGTTPTMAVGAVISIWMCYYTKN